MIQRVWNALSDVQRLFLKYPTIGNKFKHGERVFAYEFYHQLRKHFFDLHYDITGEPIKGANIVTGLNQTLIPDFVIHNFGYNENNEIAIEVKVTPKLTAKQVYQDLNKLALMLDAPLHYNSAVFFAGNCNLPEIIGNSRMYQEKILDIMANNQNLSIWFTKPFSKNIDLKERLEKDIIILQNGNMD